MALHTPLLHRLDAVKWTLYSFEIPYKKGGVRKGILVSLDNKKWAEVSPLPGRSPETLEEALLQLIDFFSGKKIETFLPSVQFGLENLYAAPFEPVSGSLYALLSGTEKEILQQADVAEGQGYCTVKVKLSPFAIPEAQALLNKLKDKFRLRADCNSAFSFKDALDLFSPFDPDLFDYIEDPTFEFTRLSEFTHPFALDERLELQSYPNLYGFILKPSLVGGKKGCAPYVDYAKKHSLNIVFSPAFESGLGLFQILRLAKELGIKMPIGLDTQRYLKYDLLQPAINFSTPHLQVDEPPQIQQQLLTEITNGTTHLPYF